MTESVDERKANRWMRWAVTAAFAVLCIVMYAKTDYGLAQNISLTAVVIAAIYAITGKSLWGPRRPSSGNGLILTQSKAWRPPLVTFLAATVATMLLGVLAGWWVLVLFSIAFGSSGWVLLRAVRRASPVDSESAPQRGTSARGPETVIYTRLSNRTRWWLLITVLNVVTIVAFGSCFLYIIGLSLLIGTLAGATSAVCVFVIIASDKDCLEQSEKSDQSNCFAPDSHPPARTRDYRKSESTWITMAGQSKPKNATGIVTYSAAWWIALFTLSIGSALSVAAGFFLDTWSAIVLAVALTAVLVLLFYALLRDSNDYHARAGVVKSILDPEEVPSVGEVEIPVTWVPWWLIVNLLDVLVLAVSGLAMASMNSVTLLLAVLAGLANGGIVVMVVLKDRRVRGLGSLFKHGGRD